MSGPSSPAPRAAAAASQDAGLGVGILPAHVEEPAFAARGDAADGHCLDDRERIAGDQHAVLERPGLGLIGVADDMVRQRRLGRHRLPLHAGGKGGAAAAHEPRGLHFGDDPRRPELDGARQRAVAAGSAISLEARGVDDADSSEQAQPGLAGLRHDRPQLVERFLQVPHGAGPERACHRGRRAHRRHDAALGRITRAHDERRRRPFALPQARAAHPGRVTAGRRRALGPERRRQRLAERLGPAHAAGDVVAHVGHGSGPRCGRKQVVEGEHPPRLGRRHDQPLADVVHRATADPADAVLDGVEGGQQEMALLLRRRHPATRRAAVALDIPGAALPAGAGGPEQPVDGVALSGGRRRADDVNIHSRLLACSPGGDYAPTASICTAAALNSAVPDFGSTASMVRWLVATSSGK